MEPSVENLCSLLVRNKLLPADTVKALYQRWRTEFPAARSDVHKFSQWLVARAYVSASQSAVLAGWLAQGRSPAVAEETLKDTGAAPAGSAQPPGNPFDFGTASAPSTSRRATDASKIAPQTERPPAPETVDFTLDTTQPTPDRPLTDSGLPPVLSARDWLMIGIGAGAVIAASVLGMLLARMNS